MSAKKTLQNIYTTTIVNAILIAGLLLLCEYASAAIKTYDVFTNGKLHNGASIKNASIQGNKIVTVRLAVGGWAKPRFEIRGLNIDISSVKNLAQIKLRMITSGGENPSYADILVYNSKGRQMHVEQFPFKAYDTNAPDYKTKGLENSNLYGEHPDGAYYGKITGFGVNCGAKVIMHFTKIQLIIDESGGEMYPDDPQPDDKWKKGKLKQVYAMGLSERVFQDELGSPLAKKNAVWDGKKVSINGARRETVAFQVVMETAPGKDGVNKVDVEFSGLKKGSAVINNKKAADAKDPYNYVGKPIQLYRSRYIKMHDKAGGFVNAKIAHAAGTLGRYTPAMQIPFEAKWGGAPFSIFPGNTQAVLLDIYIPEKTPAGLYKGTVKVTHAGKTVKSIPVELTVHDFALPNKPSMCSFMFTGSVHATRHGLKEGDRKLTETYAKFFRRHHTEIQLNSEYIKDSVFTKENGYEGRLYDMPPVYNFATFYGAGSFGNAQTEAAAHEILLGFKKRADGLHKDSKTVLYMWDEPSHGFQGGIGAFNKWVAKKAPYVKSFDKKHGTNTIMYSSTWHKDVGDSSLLGAYGSHNDVELKKMRAQGKEHWLYNGPRTYQDFASAIRVLGWKAFARQADVWWMWETTHAPNGFDYYYQSKNFTNQYGEFAIGDGLFVFPGTDVLIPKRSPGLDGPVAGIRFYNWRQGFIDLEYLTMAQKKDPKATAAICKPITDGTSLSSGLPGEKRSAGYPIGQTDYEEARKELVKIILGK
ncbi:MAG: DUF4091 domain-containing protein [Lentisphaeria bacterium]|nr:DUF4091 domain-containing protein [Lentisphaeria bacterium]